MVDDKPTHIRWRLGGCLKCGGSQYLYLEEGLVSVWQCLNCGYIDRENFTPLKLTSELWRGKLPVKGGKRK